MLKKSVALIIVLVLLTLLSGTAFADSLPDAAGRGDVAAVRVFLAAGADVNKDNKHGATPLYLAAADGHAYVVKLLLAHGANVNQTDKYGDPPLLGAARSGHADVEKILLAAGADINKIGFRGFIKDMRPAGGGIGQRVTTQINLSALGSAAMIGDIDMARFLLSHGANVNNEGYFYYKEEGQVNEVLVLKGPESALMAAIMSGHVDMVRFLLSHGANVNAKHKALFKDGKRKAFSNAFTALDYAVFLGHTNIVRILLAHGANDVGVQYWATSGGHLDKVIHVLRLAAEQGNAVAQLNLGEFYATGPGVHQDYGRAAEWYRKSAAQGNADAKFSLGLLYFNGEGVTQDYGQASHWYRLAALQGNASAQDTLGALYANGHGVPQDYGRAYKWLLLSKAGGNRNAEMAINWLMPRMTQDQIAEGQKLASEWTTAKNGSVPTVVAHRSGTSLSLIYASAQGDVDAVKRLLAHGADPNMTTWNGITPLIAAAKRSASVVRILLAHGANVNLADKNGFTPLFWASRPDIVRLLLAHGATFNPNRWGHTPFYVDALNDRYNVVRILLDHGGMPSQKDLDVAKGKSRALIEAALNPVVVRNSNPDISVKTPSISVGSTPPSSDLSEIKQMLEAQNKEIATLQSGKPSPIKSTPHYSSPVDHPSFNLRENRNAFAVVIGVEHYPGSIPRSEFSDHDAQAVFQNMRALGIPLDHIKRLTDDTATRSRINGAIHWLARNVRPNSTVWVYFSGHGAPGRKGTAYLVPFDGDPTDLSDTGVRIETLYKKLNALKARHIIVALDSCFSGQGSRSVIGAGVRPLMLKVREGAFPSSGKLIAFSAAKSDQEAGVLKDQGHGLFTYYFLKGLNKGAVHQGHVTIAGLYRYLDRRVTDKANLDNRSQTPMVQPGLSKDGSVRLR